MRKATNLKISFAVFVAIALIGMAFLTADTDDSDAAPFTVGSLNFNSTGQMGNIGTAEVAASTSPYGYTGVIVIPSTVSNSGITYAVTAIGIQAFKDGSSLTSITLPAGVTSIGNEAFRGCSSLTSITLPAGVTTIGAHAFAGCSSLTSITLPAGVTTIGERAFDGCSSLTSITMPAGLTTIGTYAFTGCSSLASITLPAGLTAIGIQAFQGCAKLTSITMPAGVTTMCEGTFYGCSSLTSITLPANLTSIGSSAFQGCAKLTSITMPANLTSIGSSAFQGCAKLTSITMPAGVTTIGTQAFFGCSSLTSITLPAGLTSISAQTFSLCANLTSITLPAGLTSIENAFSGSRIYTATINEYTVATIAGTALNTYKLTSQNTALTHVIINPKTVGAITIDTTPYRVTGKYLTIAAKPDNVTVSNFATEWKAGTPYTWNGTAWIEASIVEWKLDSQRTVTTCVKPGETPAYYWTLPNGFLGWSSEPVAGGNSYTAIYRTPYTPPITPGETHEDDKPAISKGVIVLALLIVGAIAFVGAYAYGVRHPLVLLIGIGCAILAYLLYAGHLPIKL